MMKGTCKAWQEDDSHTRHHERREDCIDWRPFSKTSIGNYVYLTGNVELNWCKIGMSSDPAQRVEYLSVPFELVLMATEMIGNEWKTRRMEKELHAFFHAKAIRREWFSLVTAKEFLDAILLLRRELN